MNKDSISALEKVLVDDLKNYDNLSLDDDRKTKAIQSIKTEFAVILSYDKEKFENEQKEKQSILENEKFDFEKKKLKSEEEAKAKQLNLEQQKFEFDKLKFQNEIENNRIQNQLAITKMENDARTAKVQIIISAAGIVSTFVLGLIGKIMYNKLAYNAQIHEYNDFQMEPVSSKENRMNLLK